METKFTRYIKLQHLNKICVLQILVNIICLNIIAKNVSVNDKITIQVMQKSLSNQSAYLALGSQKDFLEQVEK